MSSGDGASITPSATSGQDTPPQQSGFTSFDGWERIVQRLRAATLGEFEIRRELGRGGMAIVFLAQDMALRRKVAIKLMSPGLLANDEMVRKFREEAVLVAQMSHPNIITIYGVRVFEDLHFFIMKFVEGESLDKVLRDTSALPIPLVRAILFQVGSALAYAHRRGIVHRDIKPGNILIDVEGDAMVTDFGIAKGIDSENHTKTGSVVGTPAYMSPEQCYALPATWASDQYALGVVAYEMIAGTAPFTGPSFVIMRAHVDDPPPPLRNVRPDCPEELEAAIMRMLSKKPEDRFASIGQALTALGARPLNEDDPNRTELAALIRKSVPTTSLTPVSPVPTWSREQRRETEPAQGPPPPAATPAPAVASTETPAIEETVPTERLMPAPQLSTPPTPAVSADEPAVSADEPSVVGVPTSEAATVRDLGPAPAEAPAPATTTEVARPETARPDLAPAPRRVGRRGVGVGAAVVMVATLFWLVVLRRPPAPNATAGAGDTAVTTAPTPSDSATTPQPPPPPIVRAETSVAVAPPVTQPSPVPGAAAASSPGRRTPATVATADSSGVSPARSTVVRSITVSPSEVTLMVGQTVQPDVTLRGPDNRPVPGGRVVWVSPNAAIATVERATGAVTGVSVGTTEVRASSGDARARLIVHVELPVVLASVAVDQPRRLTVGENLTLSATVRDSRGNVMSDQPVSWSSADPGVAVVAARSGIVSAVGPGTADVTASAGGKAATVRVTVVAPTPPSEPKQPAPDAAAEERRTRELIESAVQRYVAALRAHDARTVTSLYKPESDQDRKNEQMLTRLMEGSAKLTASDPRVTPGRIDDDKAVADFTVPMSWRNPFGIIRQQTVAFRAQLQRDGAEWRVVSARLAVPVTP